MDTPMLEVDLFVLWLAFEILQLKTPQHVLSVQIYLKIHLGLRGCCVHFLRTIKNLTLKTNPLYLYAVA